MVASSWVESCCSHSIRRSYAGAVAETILVRRLLGPRVDGSHFLNKDSQNSVISIRAILRGEEPEEKEYVTNADTLFC
jgi:hypothetical protein